MEPREPSSVESSVQKSPNFLGFRVICGEVSRQLALFDVFGLVWGFEFLGGTLPNIRVAH